MCGKTYKRRSVSQPAKPVSQSVSQLVIHWLPLILLRGLDKPVPILGIIEHQARIHPGWSFKSRCQISHIFICL